MVGADTQRQVPLTGCCSRRSQVVTVIRRQELTDTSPPGPVTPSINRWVPSSSTLGESWHPASVSRDWVLLRLARSTPTEHLEMPRRAPTDVFPHSRFSTCVKAQRHVPLTGAHADISEWDHTTPGGAPILKYHWGRPSLKRPRLDRDRLNERPEERFAWTRPPRGIGLRQYIVNRRSFNPYDFVVFCFTEVHKWCW